MSYSRWITSPWYTFYHVDGFFRIQDVCDFTYEELQDIKKCLTKVKELRMESTIEELFELSEYMSQFVYEYKNKVWGKNE